MCRVYSMFLALRFVARSGGLFTKPTDLASRSASSVRSSRCGLPPRKARSAEPPLRSYSLWDFPLRSSFLRCFSLRGSFLRGSFLRGFSLRGFSLRGFSLQNFFLRDFPLRWLKARRPRATRGCFFSAAPTYAHTPCTSVSRLARPFDRARRSCFPYYKYSTLKL